MRSLVICAALFGSSLLFADTSAVTAPHPSWPHDVVAPVGLKLYPPAQFGQYIVVRNGSPYHEWHHIRAQDPATNVADRSNPNSKAPYHVSGGMDGLHGWKSIKLSNVAKKDVAVRTVNIPIAGAGRRLPGVRWTFPDGAVFADLLTNDAGKPFELRTRTKENGKWKSVIAFADASAAPAGYKGAGKACNVCHRDAGDSQKYGMMIRGDDTVFSFAP